MKVRDPDNINLLVKKTEELHFRGDDRDPREIFEFGFQRRGGTYPYYQAHKKILEPRVRKDTDDADPLSAVCITTIFDCAPIFPLDTRGKEAWIYVVQGRNVFPTHLYQESDLLQESTVRDIPSGDVICAIKCERYWNVDRDKKGDVTEVWANGMHYRLTGDILWNPKLANEFQTPRKLQRKKDIIDLVEKRKGQYVECPVPITVAEINALKLENRNQFPKILAPARHDEIMALVKFAKEITDHSVPSQTSSMKARHSLLKCPNVNAIIPDMDLTPLMLACQEGDLPVIKYLLDRGAKVEIKNLDGKDALDMAKTPIIRKLLEQESVSDKVDKEIIAVIDKAFVPSFIDTINPFLSSRDQKKEIFDKLKDTIARDKSKPTETIIDEFVTKHKSVIFSHRNRLFSAERPDELTDSEKLIATIKKLCRH